VPLDYKWSKDDNAASIEESLQLAQEYGFSFIEVVGSLNYLANTAICCLFAIRKACKYTRMPYPTPPLIFYHNVKDSPLAKLLIEAGHSDVDPTFCYFCDSAFMDADESRSTGCYLGFLQGGLINFASSVPQPVAMSSTEAEQNYASITCMAAAATRQALMEILHDDASRPFTVLLFTDSQSMDAIALNDRDTRNIRHVECRYFFVRFCRQTSQVRIYHIKGDKFQLADIGTKSGINQIDFDFKLSHMEAPMPMTPKVMANYARRGVMKSMPSQDLQDMEARSSNEYPRFTPGISSSPSSEQLPMPSWYAGDTVSHNTRHLNNQLRPSQQVSCQDTDTIARHDRF
jgi:hypothetical protein